MTTESPPRAAFVYLARNSIGSPSVDNKVMLYNSPPSKEGDKDYVVFPEGKHRTLSIELCQATFGVCPRPGAVIKVSVIAEKMEG